MCFKVNCFEIKILKKTYKNKPIKQSAMGSFKTPDDQNKIEGVKNTIMANKNSLPLKYTLSVL